VALIEEGGDGKDAGGNEVDGPVEALLGNVDNEGLLVKRLWRDEVTENPAVGATEIWEIYNATADAHPMHIHEVAFEVVNRESLVVNADGEVLEPVTPTGDTTPPETWETGFKDTVIAYPGQVTRVRVQFNTPGQFVWHCHIVEHEDNEMMRPFRIGPVQPGQPM
jgi:spore coat protein A